jgi:hypothetical protein
MPIKTLKRLESWSYSRFKDYTKCPKYAFYKHIEKKQKEPGSKAMDRGLLIHKLAEDYAGGVLKKLPKELEAFKQEFAELKKSNPNLEQQWTLTDKWRSTGWFDRDAWLRIKVDVAYFQCDDVMVVIDHKTGRTDSQYQDQLELYALAAFVLYRKVKKVITKIWYLDEGEEIVQEYERTDFEKLKKKWLAKTKPMLTDTAFYPKPGDYCRFCIWSGKHKGGPCDKG